MPTDFDPTTAPGFDPATVDWFDFEDDADDPMVVDLTGACSICGSPVDADGVCESGHDDLDRAGADCAICVPGQCPGPQWCPGSLTSVEADAARRLLAAGAAGVMDVEVTDAEWCPCGDQPRHTPRVHPAGFADAIAEGVADVARAMAGAGASDAAIEAMIDAAGIDPETGDPR